MFCGTCSEENLEIFDAISKITGFYKYTYEVTPSERHVLTYDEESWKSTEEKDEVLLRSSEVRQSKAKRVKNYIKKYKNALTSSGSSSRNSSTEINDNRNECSSWYVDSKLVQESEINELDDIFEDAQISLDLTDFSSIYQVANVVTVGVKCSNKDGNNGSDSSDEKASPLLTEEQKQVEEENVEEENKTLSDEQPKVIKSDVASLVDKYFGHLYDNYNISRLCLIRQARNLLVCEYHGCLQKFENEFCVQAAKLLHHIKTNYSFDGTTPLGWPLCLGSSGIVIHLGPLDSSIVRNRDCYLCIRNRSAPGLELTLIWRKNCHLHCHTIAEFTNPLQNLDDIMCSNLDCLADLELSSYDQDYDCAELPELLQNLLVSVEHAIERVPLDDLTFPCPHCLQYLPLDVQEEFKSCSCQCFCKLPDNTAPAKKKDTSIQTSPMFEFAGSIPHIDSDEEEDKDNGCTAKKAMELAKPERITDLPEKLLMSGINLPGTADVDGRPIILCYAECINRAGLNKYEIAKLLLYYTSIPTLKSREKGFTILLLAENEKDNKVLELLDKSILLITASVKILQYLIWKPGCNHQKQKPLLTSRIEAITITDEDTLANYLTKDQAPLCCGGTCTHDQLEWVEFFKQLEPFLVNCKSAGRSLLTTLSLLRKEDVPQQVTRRFLNHQCRQITKSLENEEVQKLRREGNKTLANLQERSQWLCSSEDVKRNVKFAISSFNTFDKVTKRLEQLKCDRIERCKELARFRTLEDETNELLSWTHKVGEDTLNNLSLQLRSVSDATGVKEIANYFEQFFFTAWRQIEKSTDLVDECRNINHNKGQTLKDSSSNLQNEIKSFRERLEETREQLEDCLRCFLLLDSCQDILEDDNKEQEEFYKLAEKSKNEKLLQICQNSRKQNAKLVQPPDKQPIQLSNNKQLLATSTPIKSQNTQIRRRSVSSLAYIYHCNHHAAGELCNCYESDTENTVSFKLKKKYLQTLQNCACTQSTLERKNSATLGGIKEERESMEDILEKIESECRRCDSGLSTADNSVGDDSSFNNIIKKKLQRTCSCQYYQESCTLCNGRSGSSVGSNQDNTENQQDSIIEEENDGFIKSNSSEDIEEEHYSEERRRQVPPISANNHLYCHASNLDLPSDALYSNMDPKTQKTLTYIIKEMIETERDYVKSLDYIIVNYIPELMRDDIPQALRGQRNIVFGNVEKIYEFHSQHFLSELEECEHNPLQVGQIFLKYDKRFYLYALYNKNKPKSDSLMSEYGSTFFKTKQLELKDKMDLASYLLKPVQRMGKYALLLQQIMKACDGNPGTAQEIEDIKQAEEMVRFKLRHGNDLLAMDSIRDCDVNLKEQGALLRQNEFLVWEGRSGKKSLRQVFLFEELILFSKAKRFPDRKNLDLYYYKNSIKMTDIGLTAKIGDSPTKFEIWFRKRKPNDTFTLQSMSEDVKKAWTEELSQLLWKQAIKNRAVRMAEMSSMGIGNKPCLDIRPSADQINDRSISVDQLSRTAPRFRNSIVGPVIESCRNTKRPHSVISMSSVSSSSTSSGGSAGGHSNHQSHTNSVTLGYESACESPKPYHRSATLNSQCSVESGIIADMSMGSDECSEQTHPGLL